MSLLMVTTGCSGYVYDEQKNFGECTLVNVRSIRVVD